MKSKTRIMTMAGLLLAAAGVWLFWAHGPSRTAGPAAAPSRPLAASVPRSNAAPAAAPATNAPAKFPTLNTNKLAYRLFNTTNSIRQLQNNPHAILLANAFIDTDKPLGLKIPPQLQAAGDPHAYIVQARGPIDGRFRNVLLAAGAQVVSYIPNNAYLVNLSADLAGALSANPLVQAVLPYQPYYKLQSSLLGLAVNAQALPPGTALTLGVFGSDAATAETQLAALGAKIIGQDQSPFGPVYRVVPPADWTTLAQSPVVQYLEPAFTRRPANDLSRVTVGISPDTISPYNPDGYAVNGYVLTGAGVLVDINDSGVDSLHPDFSLTGTAEGPGTSPPSRVYGLTPLDLVDTNGHGTVVAGIIAGNGSASYTMLTNEPEGSVPYADFRGKAPLANLFSVNDGQYSDYQLQTNAALAHPPNGLSALISNNSWDYGNGDAAYDLAAASYDFATRDAVPGNTGSQPVLFVFASGNNGGGQDDGTGGSGDTILSPGTAKNVITVGALEQFRNITNIVTTITYTTGTNGQTISATNTSAYWLAKTDTGDPAESSQVAYYSSRGNVGIGTEGSFGRFKPDVVSPGTMVVSTSSQFNNQWDTNAYYNPTNDQQSVYLNQVVTTNALLYYPVAVPPNAVGVNITITPNADSPDPLPNLIIYCQQSSYPDPVNFPNLIDITSYTNSVTIPPGGGNCTLPSLLGNGFWAAVGSTNNFPVNFNLTVDIYATNDVGDLYSVLEGMNDNLGGYYRYESGTSLAAADVSGVLALIQDYLTNSFTPAVIPSPALLKALLINGCRSLDEYGIAFTNGINFQGWGLDNIQDCVPDSGLFNIADGSTEGSSFFVDQNPTNALATGDSHTYIVNIDTNNYGNYFQMQATLVWTDPPGDPAAAIKLVNSLELVITNLDANDPNYGAVYYGNDIASGDGVNLPWNTNGPPNIDTINNVQNILLPPGLGAKYSVTVIGRSVNVNAVTAQTNNAAGQFAPNIVQDFALVFSVGEGEITNAFSVADPGVASNPTGGQDFSVITSTNTPLMNQLVGANSPLLGTNLLALGTNTVWGPNGVLAIGQTNQWHFYLITNTGPTSDYTNAAFITFGVNTLSVPRMGVYEQDIANATKPEANINMFVTLDPSITNLNPVAISNCLAGVGTSQAALANAGTQYVFYTNSVPAKSIYYVGIQSEDQMGAEYDFLPVFTDVPFSSLDQNGNQIVNGLLLPTATPTGNNAHPGVTNIFALAIMPMVVEKVTVTNLDQHQNFGDLYGSLSFGGQSVVLNNHDGYGNTFNRLPIAYDDSPDRLLGTTNTDGPGSLLNFRGQSALGPWILTILDDSAGGFTGQVARLTLLIQPHRDLKEPGVIVDVPPGGWFVDYVDVPAGYTNLTFFATNGPPIVNPAIEMFEKYGDDPTLTYYDQEVLLTNTLPGAPAYPESPSGNSISIGPPLAEGRYFIGLFNPSSTDATNVFLTYTLGIGLANNTYSYTASSGQSIPDDAVTPAPAPSSTLPGVGLPPTTIAVSATNIISSVSVGIVMETPRISDYTFTLVSPTGQRILLMENRGGTDTNGAGSVFVYTNVLNSTATGGAAANTNYLSVNPNPFGMSVPITWNFFTVPDQMTVYGSTNPADFYLLSPTLLYNTGLTNNVPTGGGGGAQDTIPVTYDVQVPPLVTNITIIMNQFGNPDAKNGDAWTYTAGAPITNYEYLVFTDNTNQANVPIKFAPTPFSFTEASSNFTLSDFDLATNGDYHGLTNIYDAYGGWTVPTNVVTIAQVYNSTNFIYVTNVLLLTNNVVSIVTDPSSCLTGDSGGSNYLALANGTITRAIPTVPGNTYSVTFWYRGPGIAGWWRGEGNANDSSDPENVNNNGTLFGPYSFAAGEVDQAFDFEDFGSPYLFAGTNAYVQVPASPSLDVGTGGGFSLEGWICLTNVNQPQPIFEWISRVPTNTAITNISIAEGPFLNPGNGYYYYLLAPTNWATSEAWAEELGGHLVTMTTANLENWVYDTFTDYGATNRYLWIGLTNNPGGLPAFAWSSGLTNMVYTNWLATQPNNCDNLDFFTLILSPTNTEPGLWALADANGFICGDSATNLVYGVVELTNLPPIGVQFWACATNSYDPNVPVAPSPGGLEGILPGAAIINGVTNYGELLVSSAPGLLQTNVFQHVVLSYSTNTGLARLYLNGTNVPVTLVFTNFSTSVGAGASNAFVLQPNTSGDLFLGRDLTHYTNNYFGGLLDEMSVYGRALSDAEILAIYSDSANTTNRTIGKFDPAVTPAAGLAEALVTFGTVSNVIYGVNNQWEVNSYTFTATSNSMPLTISGLEPGILLDSFAVEEAPQTNLYYLPEQDLSALNGDSANGNWTLQIWDNRAGAYVPTADQLVNWDLSLVLVTNAVISASLPPQTPVTTTPPAGQTVYYSVTVPAWANDATNLLVASDQPVNLLYFSPANEPNGSGNPPDATLLGPATSGIGLPILMTNSPPPFKLVHGSTYYLGVQNLGARTATVTLEVDYDILALTNGAPFTDVLTNEYSAVRYYSYLVSSNAFEATFQLLQLNGTADLVVSKGLPLPQMNAANYASYNNNSADQNIYVLTNSTPVPLSVGQWYLGVFNSGSAPVQYSVLAKELDLANANTTTNLTVIDLTNAAPYSWTMGPGADLTNYFHFHATNSVVNGTNINLQGLRFELYSLTGNGDMTLQTNALPLAPPFFQTSQNSGNNPELINVVTNSVLTNLAGDWFVGVPNRETNSISYTIVVGIQTNLYFPAFPGAQGAGGGAVGAGHAGAISSVYHVITNADSGWGSLRDAVGTNNRTVVFDIAGTINLATPLWITNSNLTIAGQTSPGGITVAGQMTVTNAHDVVIRDIRLRTSPGTSGLAGDFEGVSPGDYLQGKTVNGWTVLANQSSVMNDRVNAYTGHSNYLALASGVLSNSIATVPGRAYSVTTTYRGPGIVAWWKGDGSGQEYISGDTATWSGTAAYAVGEVGQAFDFNANYGSYLAAPDESALNPTNALTVECWAEVLGPGVNGYLAGHLVQKDSSCNFGIRQYLLEIADTTTTRSDVRGTFWNPSGTAYSLNGGSTLNYNTWYHLAMTYDGVTLKVYLNGNLDGSLTANTPIVVTSEPVRLGGGGDIPCTEGSSEIYPENGLLDEPSIYNRALSDSELKAIYSAGPLGKYDHAVFTNSASESLAEAAFSLPGIATNVLLGNNLSWQQQTTTFVATGSATPMVLQGVQPGMLVDSISVAAVPELNGVLQFNTVSNLIVDHVSTSWATNEALTMLASTNVTVQWSTMADSLYSTNNELGLGSRVRGGNGALSFHHNLYADNYSDNPRLGDNLTLDFVNNVIYNWGLQAGLTGGTNDFDISTNGCTNQLNYVCNYLIAGPDTAALIATNYNNTNTAFFGGVTNALAANWIFQTNNFIDSDTNGILNGADTGWGMFTNDYTPFGRAFAIAPVQVDEAYQAYEEVLDFAGANLGLRDAVDTNIVTKVRYQNGRIISAPGTLPIPAAALPYLDTDQDGLPDFWEDTFTTNLLYTPSNNNDRNGDGYTDLEEYNNWLAAPHALTTVTNPVAIDMYQLCGESGHLAFLVTNNIHGFVYLTNVIGTVTNTQPGWSNSIAVFTPTNNFGSGTNYFGYASFDFYVTNLDTAAYIGPMTVSVIVSAVPILTNRPITIVTLSNGIPYDPWITNGSDYYQITIPTNASAAVFELLSNTGPMALVVSYGHPPSLSDYDYYTNVASGNLELAVLTNSLPVPLTNGVWYMAAVDEDSSAPVYYIAEIGYTASILPPIFDFPTNNMSTNILETVPWSLTCQGQDLDSPILPLTYSLVSGPIGMTISNGVLSWTPGGTYQPTTNTVQVSVSNGAFSVTNTFTVNAEVTNQAPVLPVIPNQFVVAPGSIVVTNTATDANFPITPLGYVLSTTPFPGPNQPVIDPNGLITWSPTADQGETNYVLTTVVTNWDPYAVNGPSQSATNTVDIFVVPTFTPGQTNTFFVPQGFVFWFEIPVPTNAIYATNALLYSTLPVNIWFSTNLPPTITNSADKALIWNATSGISVLSTNRNTAPTNIVQGGYYFLGVQNTNAGPVSGAIEISFAYAPVPTLTLPAIPDQYLAAGDTLVVTNTATDTYPNPAPAYTLTAAPAGAVIDTNGVITWATSPIMAAPTNLVFTTVVTDSGAGVSATNSFNVVVLPGLGGGGGPITNIVAPGGINWFYIHVPARADLASNFLLFATAPVNLWFSSHQPPSITNSTSFEMLTNSLGGEFTMNTATPPVLVPGGRYFLGVQNTNSFAVTNAVDVKFHLVKPVFSIFSIVATNNAAGSNGFLVTWYAPASDQFHLQWSPLLVPSQWTNFNGVISDTAFKSASSSQFQYFDDGSQTGGFGPTRFYRLLLLNSPSNTAPYFLSSPAVFFARPGVPFVFTNTAADWDIPAQTLAYTLTNSLMATNVTINPLTGVITWTPTPAQAGLTNDLFTTVTDNGVPPKSATNSFLVIVGTNNVPAISGIVIGATGVQFQWTAPTNEQFQIRWTTNLAAPNWTTIPYTITSAVTNFSFVDSNLPLVTLKFYQLVLVP